MNIPIDYQIGIGALASVVLGWVLGQGATIVKDWRTLRRLRQRDRRQLPRAVDVVTRE